VGVEFRFSKSPFGYTSFSIETSELGGDNSVVKQAPVGVSFWLSKNPFGSTSFSVERSELGGDNSVVLSMVGR